MIEPVTCYAEMMQGLRERVSQLGVRYIDFDVLAGFPLGLSGKVFGPAEAKRLGPEKMFDALRAAGLRIKLEEDPEQTARMAQRISENFLPRQANQARTNNRNYNRPSEVLINRVLIHLASNRGGLARLNAAAREARANWARLAAFEMHKRRKSKVVDFADYLESAAVLPNLPASPEMPRSTEANAA